MLDVYGWESVFYLTGLLSVLWAYCMWKCLLKGEGDYIAFLAITFTSLPLLAWAVLWSISVFIRLHCCCLFSGPIITLESLGSGGSQSKLTKRHWLRLFKQPAVWFVKY